MLSHEINVSPIKEVPRLFKKKHYSFNYIVSKLDNSHYRNVSTDLLEHVTDPLESAEHHLGTTAIE